MLDILLPNHMLQSARFKLTAWYLLTIMLISIFFSMAFYHSATQEIQRVIRRIQSQQDHKPDDFHPSPPRSLRMPTLEDLRENEERIRLTLIFINGFIFFFAGGAGYFLAGRTLRPIKEMLDEQNRFITDSSHELRTPLTALRSEMEASLLDDKLTTHEAKRLIASNLEEVINLQSLSDNLLQLAQYQKRKAEQYKAEVSLLQAIEDSLKTVTPIAKKKKITIKVKIKDTMIYGDQSSLTQLFVILLENAIKYSKDKTEISILSKVVDHNLKVQIIDQGMGIEAKDLPHIFDRFYRADKSRTKTDISGYGLGLSIAQKIVELHKGAITVQSKIEKGTTFSVLLPIYQA
jgi:two-component system sensor histidine kinase CiaH